MPYISSHLGSERAQTQILRTLRYNNTRQQRQQQRQPRTVDSAITLNDPSLLTFAPPLGQQPLQPLQQIPQLGPCTIICSDCNALHWIEEKSTKSRGNDEGILIKYQREGFLICSP
jgi:hypothetical protein